MKRPGRTIPIAVLGGTVVAAVLYILIALPAAGVLPIPKVANQPLSIVAKTFMPHGAWLFFILGGAVLAVIGTMNAQMLWGSKSLLASVDDGWFPKKVGAVNKRFGTPHYLLTFLFIIGILPAATHISIAVIANTGSAIGQVVFIVVLFASLRLPFVRPDLHAKSPFKIPLGWQWAFTIAGTAVCGYQTYLLTQNLSRGVYIALVVWLALGLAWFFIRYPRIKASLKARGASAPLPGADDVIAVALPALAPIDVDERSVPRSEGTTP